MTECEEIAQNIWQRMWPRRLANYAEGVRIARLNLQGESQTIIDNVANALWQLDTQRREQPGYR